MAITPLAVAAEVIPVTHPKTNHSESLTTKNDINKISSHIQERSADSTSSDMEKQSLESTSDGSVHQVILRKGQEVSISWTKEEERRVVRKADLLFLPLFTVGVMKWVREILSKADVRLCGIVDVYMDGYRPYEHLWSTHFDIPA